MTTYERADLVSDVTAEMIKKHARGLIDDIHCWIVEHHPELLEPTEPGDDVS